MTCRQLGGACDMQFQAETFGRMTEISMQHGIEMMNAQEAEHLQAIEKMKVIMQNPDTMHQWFEEKRAEFDALADD